MSIRLSKVDRQWIVDDFADRHGGRFDPKGFVEEVRQTKGQHQAWTWFTWDDAKAAEDHRIWQARTFVRDLVVLHTVETIWRGKVNVREVVSPAFVSPMDDRDHGGGYLALDPSDPVQMAGFCAEAARSLHAWLRRYSGVVAYTGGSPAALEKQVVALEKASLVEAVEAA